MRLGMLVGRLLAPCLALHSSGGRADSAAVVGAVSTSVALVMAVEAIAVIEVAALPIAHGVTFVVAKQIWGATVGTRLLPLLQAVALVPLALGVKACLVAVAVANPVSVAIRRAASRLCRAVLPIPVAGRVVALRVALAVAECAPVAPVGTHHRQRLSPLARLLVHDLQ